MECTFTFFGSKTTIEVGKEIINVKEFPSAETIAKVEITTVKDQGPTRRNYRDR